MAATLACIVEGDGEVEAVPVLIRRIIQAANPGAEPNLPRPIRKSRDKLIKLDELEKAVQFAARQAGDGGGILILIDADDDCPAELGPELLDRARKVRSDRAIAVVAANREFEAWFLAAAESLRGSRGLPTDLVPPPDPEAVRGAKEWLRVRTERRVYSPTVDQPKLTAKIDLDEAAGRSPSFARFRREVLRLAGLGPKGGTT